MIDIINLNQLSDYGKVEDLPGVSLFWVIDNTFVYNGGENQKGRFVIYPLPHSTDLEIARAVAFRSLDRYAKELIFGEFVYDPDSFVISPVLINIQDGLPGEEGFEFNAEFQKNPDFICGDRLDIPTPVQVGEE